MSNEPTTTQKQDQAHADAVQALNTAIGQRDEQQARAERAEAEADELRAECKRLMAKLSAGRGQLQKALQELS